MLTSSRAASSSRFASPSMVRVLCFAFMNSSLLRLGCSLFQKGGGKNLSHSACLLSMDTTCYYFTSYYIASNKHVERINICRQRCRLPQFLEKFIHRLQPDIHSHRRHPQKCFHQQRCSHKRRCSRGLPRGRRLQVAYLRLSLRLRLHLHLCLPHLPPLVLRKCKG